MKSTIDTFAGVAVAKEDMVRNSVGKYWVLSMLAGIYFGFGILLIFTIGAQFAGAGSVSVKVIMGVSLAVALTLVIFAGAELFTTNNMVMIVGCLKGKTGWGWMAWLWFVNYFGNLAGAVLIAWVIACTGLADGTGNYISEVASAKMNDAWMTLFSKGIICNVLVCLAVWMVARTKNEAARILLIFLCLFAFVATGLEHSVANMAIFSVSLFASSSDVSCAGFAYNQLPVVVGNIVGGGIFGVMYWYAACAPDQGLVPDGGE